MKLEDYKSTYEEFSGKLSDISRNLSFMGFGVVWILIGGLENFRQGKIPILLEIVLGGLVLALILDILHYVYQTIIWYYYFKKLEKKYGPTTKKDDFTAPDIYTQIGWIFFWAKIIALFSSYMVLLWYIIKLVA